MINTSNSIAFAVIIAGVIAAIMVGFAIFHDVGAAEGIAVLLMIFFCMACSFLGAWGLAENQTMQALGKPAHKR